MTALWTGPAEAAAGACPPRHASVSAIIRELTLVERSNGLGQLSRLHGQVQAQLEALFDNPSHRWDPQLVSTPLFFPSTPPTLSSALLCRASMLHLTRLLTDLVECGRATNKLAVKMIFYPMNFIGLKIKCASPHLLPPPPPILIQVARRRVVFLKWPPLTSFQDMARDAPGSDRMDGNCPRQGQVHGDSHGTDNLIPPSSQALYWASPPSYEFLANSSAEEDAAWLPDAGGLSVHCYSGSMDQSGG